MQRLYFSFSILFLALLVAVYASRRYKIHGGSSNGNGCAHCLITGCNLDYILMADRLA